MASLVLSSASWARTSASWAFSCTALSSSSCFFWYSGARFRVSRSCRKVRAMGVTGQAFITSHGCTLGQRARLQKVGGLHMVKLMASAAGPGDFTETWASSFSGWLQKGSRIFASVSSTT